MAATDKKAETPQVQNDNKFALRVDSEHPAFTKVNINRYEKGVFLNLSTQPIVNKTAFKKLPNQTLAVADQKLLKKVYDANPEYRHLVQSLDENYKAPWEKDA